MFTWFAADDEYDVSTTVIVEQGQGNPKKMKLKFNFVGPALPPLTHAWLSNGSGAVAMASQRETNLVASDGPGGRCSSCRACVACCAEEPTKVAQRFVEENGLPPYAMEYVHEYLKQVTWLANACPSPVPRTGRCPPGGRGAGAREAAASFSGHVAAHGTGNQRVCMVAWLRRSHAAMLPKLNCCSV